MDTQRRKQHGSVCSSKCRSTLLLIMLVLIPVTARSQAAFDFTLDDIDGKQVTLSEFANERVVLLSFWATWCVPCKKEHPHLQRFQDEYGEKGLTVLAISVDGPTTIAGVKQYISRYGYTFTTLLDTDSEVLSFYNPQIVLPFSVLIDRSGMIASVHHGYSPGDENLLEDEIRTLLDQPPRQQVDALSTHVSEAFLYRRFTDEGYLERERSGRSSQIINQVDVSVTRSDFILSLRFDSNLDYSPWRDTWTIEKKYFEMNRGGFSIRLGDFYHSIGRGLSLSLLKIFEEEGLEYIIDTTISGGKIGFSGGAWSADLFSGNIRSLDTRSTDRISGSTIGWKKDDVGSLNLSLLTSDLEQNTIYGVSEVTVQTVGVDIPVLLSPFRLYGEFARMQHGSTADHAPTGRGIYIESGFTSGNTSILLEMKDYRDFSFTHNRPPTLESEDLDILASQFDTDLVAVSGVALRIDHFIPSITTLLYSRFSYFDDHPQDHPLYGSYRRIGRHGYAGIEKRFGEGGYINALAGIRDEDNATLVFQNMSGRTGHGQVNVNIPLTSRLSVEADWKGKRFIGEDLRYYENRSFLSLHYSPVLVLTLFMDRSDDPEVVFFEGQNSWQAVQLETRITPAHTLRLFWGATKGAVKCAGGVCRYFPPFKGLRIEAILSL